MSSRIFRAVPIVAVMGMIIGTGTAWSHTNRVQSAAGLAYAATGHKVSFASDPSMFGGGDQGMDNLYTLNNFICTDGIATNVVYQTLGDVNNSSADQGHALRVENVQDYGTTATDPSSSSTQVSLAGATYPFTLFTSNDNTAGSGTPATDSNSLWTGQTAKVHFQSPEPVGEEIVMTLDRLDHGFVLNEDDSAKDGSGNLLFPASNGDDSRPNLYMGWKGTDDQDTGVTSFNTPPTTPNIDGDWYVGPDGKGSTDGSSFDDVVRTDQSPSGAVDPSSPNSDPSYIVTPNPSTSTVSDCVIDQKAPQTAAALTPSSPDQNNWYREPVTVTLTPHKAYYLGGAVTTYYNLDSKGWTKYTPPLTVSSDGAHTLHYYSSDALGDGTTSDAQSVSFNIDQTPPTISITRPAANATYTLNQSVAASYACTDNASGSGVATCVGNVPNGSNIDTSLGNKTFTVNASDNAGNAAQPDTVAYSVGYKAQQAAVANPGGGLAVFVQLWDANNTNLSASSITVTALRIVNSNGATVMTLNAPFTFTTKGPAGFNGGTYLYTNSVKSLASGTYHLQYKAGNDPTTHSVSFTR